MVKNNKNHASNQQLPRQFEHQMYVGKLCLNGSSGRFNQSSEKFIFGVDWKIRWQKENDKLGVYLTCEPKDPQEPDWKIEGTSRFLLSSYGGHSKEKTMPVMFDENTKEVGDAAFIIWEELEQHYLANGFVNIKVTTEIERTTVAEKKSIDYEDPNAREWDVILVVEGRKFHLLKSELQLHSPYFEGLFSGHFSESSQQEITVNDVYAPDFQKFLEFMLVYHMTWLPDDSTVAGVIALSSMYMIKPPSYFVRFLNSRTTISVKERLQLALLYDFKDLQNHCIELFNASKDALFALQTISPFWKNLELKEQMCAEYMKDAHDLELCALVESIVKEENAYSECK